MKRYDLLVASGNALAQCEAAVWDTATATRCKLQVHYVVSCVASVPGDLVATGSFCDETVCLFHTATGAHAATLEGHTGCVRALAMLPDGRLASGSDDTTVRLWDLSTRVCTAELQHHDGINELAALEGGYLASVCSCSENEDLGPPCSECFKIYLWNTTSGMREALLEGHKGDVGFLAALPQGLLASGSIDTTVRVWNVAARTCVAVLQGHKGAVGRLAALPDGRLASACYGMEDETSASYDTNDVILVWELRPSE